MPAYHDTPDLDGIIANYDPEAEPADRVRTAQALIESAISILHGVVRETGDRNAEAYVVDHLRILAGSGHGFLDSSQNLDDWIERLEDGDEEDDEDD